MAILNKRISSATLPQLQKDTRLGSIIRDVGSAPATQNEMFRTINPSASTNETPSPAYVSQLTSALREMQNSPQNMTSRIAPTQSNNVSLMSSQMPDVSNAPNISKGPITSITSSGDSARQKIGSTTSTSGGVSSALINALAGAVMGAGASKLINGKTTTTPAANNPAAKQPVKPPVTSTTTPVGGPDDWKKNPTINDNGNDTYTQTMDDGSTITFDKNGNILFSTEATNTNTVDQPTGNPLTQQQIDDINKMDETPVVDVPAGKRGGLAVMMKDGGVPHFADAGVVTSTDTTTSDPVQSLLDLLGTTGGAAGAGGILAALLSSTGGNTTTQNTGLDMSTYGLLNPRTTNFGMGPAKYVSHKDYSPQSTYTPNAELLHNLSAPASNPVNEGDYTPNYVTNRPGTTNNQGTDINAIIAQIVNALQNKQLVQNVNQASNTGGTSGIQGGGTSGIQGGGSNVTTGTKPPTTPSSTTSTKPFDTAELKASYDRLGKSGGTQTDLNSWINAQINAGASAADLAKATGYNVADVQKVIDTARAASHGTAPTGSGVAGIQSGSSSSYTRDYGLKSQGYSRDYTPSQLATMEQTFQQYRNDPVKLASLMNQYGVTTKDLALAMGGTSGSRAGDTTALNNIFESAGISTTNPIFSGGGTTTDEQKQFIAWQGSQVNPVTGQKMSDEWAARGIKDPYSDPALVAQANQQIIRAGDREALGVPSSQTRQWSSTAVPTATPTVTPAAPKVDPSQPWLTASSDTNIKSLQDQIAAVNATTGTPAQRQAALNQFLASTTATPEELFKAVNGQYSQSDLTTALQNQHNAQFDYGAPVYVDPTMTDPSVGQSTSNPAEMEKANALVKSLGFGGTDAIPSTNSPAGGLAAMATQASAPINSVSTDGIPTASSAIDPNSIWQNPGDPIAPSGPTPEELAAQAQAAADAQAYQYGGYGGMAKGGPTHKATGGLTHYTFGKPADVMENLGLRQQQMARGGLPHVSNVPVVQGRMDFRQGSAVHGEGDGQSDDIPAMLADGEYVIDAETVAQIGNGSTKAGAQALDKFREGIRAHKRSAPINKIPPKTKALTSYLKVK